MLHDLPFEGTIKVVNKGVDVTLLADADSTELAFAASRALVVCGISTAVLEVTCLDPIDSRTLGYYAQTTPVLIALSQEILEAARPVLHGQAALLLFDGGDRKALIAAVRQAVYKKR